MPDEACFRFGQNALQIVTVERLQFDADRKPALQFRQEIGRLCNVKSARRDEQDVVCFHSTVFGRYSRSLDQRQKVALHALAADVGTLAFGARADLVDLVEEDDAILLHGIDGLLNDLVLIEKLVRLFCHQHIMAGLHRHAPGLRPAAKRLAQHVGEIDDAGRRTGHTRNLEASRSAGICHLNLDFLVVHLARAQLFAECLARRFRGVGADQRLDHAVLGIELCLRFDILAPCRLHHRDAGLDEIAHDLVDIAADITDFRELGRLDLQEGRIRQFREPPRNLGLSHAGRADHQDVLRHHLFTERPFELLAPPAVAERDRDRALGICLAHDVAVEL